MATEIAKNEKLLFLNSTDLGEMQNQFTLVKNACPNAFPQMMAYIDLMISNRTPANKLLLAGHLEKITRYVTGTGLIRPAAVFGDGGGADVLTPGTTFQQMLTFDGMAGLRIPAEPPDVTGVLNSVRVSVGPTLFTFDPDAAGCTNTTLRETGRCYNVAPFPAYHDFEPNLFVGLCPVVASSEPHGVIHEAAFGAELLVSGPQFPAHCGLVASTMNSWLGREAGPLGRILARAYDYLRPRPLFADDAGESGGTGDFSLVGGVLPVVFADSFSTAGIPPVTFDSGTSPVVGEPWEVVAEHPATVQVLNALGNLSGKVLVISQALGNCDDCPEVRALGLIENPAASDNIGSYEIRWTSVQSKSSAKLAPFVVQNFAGDEIARVSYITQGSTNTLWFRVGNDSSQVGFWTRNIADSFKMIINLTMLDSDSSHKVSLSVNGGAAIDKQPASNATSLAKIGYKLGGIDAGVIGIDSIRVIRRSDVPPIP